MCRRRSCFRQLTLAGLKNWVEYGIRNYRNHPERQKDYFSLQSADSRAVLQRERHGTLFMDVERKLDLYLRGLWQDTDQLVPYSTAFDELRKPVPYYDKLGMRMPDVYDDAGDITGLDRYRATLAHMVGHRRWTRAQIADNWSPFQRMAVEFFEDCRIETLLCASIPACAHLPGPAPEAGRRRLRSGNDLLPAPPPGHAVARPARPGARLPGRRPARITRRASTQLMAAGRIEHQARSPRWP